MPKAPTYVDQYLQRFYKRVHAKLVLIQKKAASGLVSNQDAMKAITGLKPLTEHVNQFHHEYLCLRGLQRLKKLHPDLEWHWQSTNTGSATEADLEGRDAHNKLIVAAECSASIEAKGTLRDRMNSALEKLSTIKASHRYYFALEAKMAAAANNRAETKGYRISVMRLM
jgi:hypothetical protein